MLFYGLQELGEFGHFHVGLWVGVHALSNDWTVLSLTLLPIENDLTFFLLSVATANASMAAAFVHHENWLSQAVNAIGLANPPLGRLRFVGYGWRLDGDCSPSQKPVMRSLN